MSEQPNNNDIRNSIGKCIRLEFDGNAWLGHVDLAALQSLSGIQASSHALSKEHTIDLFNEASVALGAPPLRDPCGYMRLDNNVQEYINKAYRDKYEGARDNIYMGYIDSSGVGVEKILGSLNSNIREDIKEYLPQEMNFGDLRFMACTPERKTAVDAMARTRVSLTLMYERQRTYEPETQTRMRQEHLDAGEAFKKTLLPFEQCDLEL